MNMEISNNNNNQSYIITNKEDLNSMNNLEKKFNNVSDNNNYSTFNNNDFFGYNNNLLFPNMTGLLMMNQNTFFDKLFMTLERANYQMYHLCEMIKTIKSQKQSLIFLKSLLISASENIKIKYFECLEILKSYLSNLKNVFTFDNEKYNEEELTNHIKLLDYIIKFLLFTICLFFGSKMI